MSKIATSIVILVAISLIYYLFKNKKKKRYSCGVAVANCLVDSDYNKIKTIPPLKCIECDNCAVESNGCCANCNAGVNLLAESQGQKHCREHNHSHSHNHDHKHHFSPSKNIKGYFSLLLIPLILGVAVYRIVGLIRNKD